MINAVPARVTHVGGVEVPDPFPAITAVEEMEPLQQWHETVSTFVYRAAYLGATIPDVAGILALNVAQIFTHYLTEWNRGHSLYNLETLSALKASVLNGDVRAQIFAAQAQAGLTIKEDVTIHNPSAEKPSYEEMSMEQLVQERKELEELMLRSNQPKAIEALPIDGK